MEKPPGTYVVADSCLQHPDREGPRCCPDLRTLCLPGLRPDNYAKKVQGWDVPVGKVVLFGNEQRGGSQLPAGAPIAVPFCLAWRVLDFLEGAETEEG